MNLSDKAYDILATISLAQFVVIAAIIIGIGVFIFKSRDIIKKVFEDYRVKENNKEEFVERVNNTAEKLQILEHKHDKDMKKFYDNQMEYRKQSLQKQQDIDNHFTHIDKKMDKVSKEIKDGYDLIFQLQRNDKRSKLIDYYNKYASIENNPNQTWNEMEADNFWSLMEDYEQLGGNGYIHNIVKPAMKKLTITTL